MNLHFLSSTKLSMKEIIEYRLSSIGINVNGLNSIFMEFLLSRLKGMSFEIFYLSDIHLPQSKG